MSSLSSDSDLKILDMYEPSSRDDTIGMIIMVDGETVYPARFEMPSQMMVSQSANESRCSFVLYCESRHTKNEWCFDQDTNVHVMENCTLTSVLSLSVPVLPCVLSSESFRSIVCFDCEHLA